VLIGLTLRRTRPAASLRRRSFLYGGLLATVGVGFAATSFVGEVAGRPISISATRRASLFAVKSLRPEVPATARLLDRLIADAEIATAHEASAPPWERSPGRVEAAWGRVLITAHGALTEVGGRKSGQRARWTSLAAPLRADVHRALAEANEAGVGRREISAAKQANLKLTLAERYAAMGAHDRALREAEEARSLVGVVHSGFASLHARFGDAKLLARWRQMVDETVAESRATGATAFVVDKLNRKLLVYSAGRRIAAYEVELGVKGLRQKVHAGDQATPEGRYRVSQVKGEGRSKFYKALLINYPNDEDRARYAYGRKVGTVPLRAGIGSLIEIHGEGGQGRDWTDGCIALDNRSMDAVFARARTGTPVTIVGTF
jgi:L,D-peptidoglycan transpeptidase YkuD (ErfK/YbiS/YcfS/YnhG family)